jgi:hypothetical protein
MTRMVDALKITYPLSTTSISNNSDIIAVIVIDGNGKFVRFCENRKKTNQQKKVVVILSSISKFRLRKKVWVVQVAFHLIRFLTSMGI